MKAMLRTVETLPCWTFPIFLVHYRGGTTRRASLLEGSALQLRMTAANVAQQGNGIVPHESLEFEILPATLGGSRETC